MSKVTLAEIVAKWERQLEALNTTKKGFEVRNKYETTELVNNTHYQRTVARIEMITEHINELKSYALAMAR